MADPCIIKSGEVVMIDDPRLTDTGCMVEVGAIIRPPTDLSIVVPQKPKSHPRIPAPVAPVSPAPPAFEMVKIEEPKVAQPARVKEVLQSVTAQPEPVKKDENFHIDSPVIVGAVVGTVAVAGVAATSFTGGISALQAKVASIFGASKATVATSAVITAGTIVAVKALETKMSSLESSLKKTKAEVDETSAAADRIDELLSRLGS